MHGCERSSAGGRAPRSRVAAPETGKDQPLGPFLLFVLMPIRASPPSKAKDHRPTRLAVGQRWSGRARASRNLALLPLHATPCAIAASHSAGKTNPDHQSRPRPFFFWCLMIFLFVRSCSILQRVPRNAKASTVFLLCCWGENSPASSREQPSPLCSDITSGSIPAHSPRQTTPHLAALSRELECQPQLETHCIHHVGDISNLLESIRV